MKNRESKNRTMDQTKQSNICEEKENKVAEIFEELMTENFQK